MLFDSFFEETIDGILIDRSLAILACTLVAFLCGIVITAAYRLKNERSTKSLMITMFLLPVVVMTIVMVVNRENSIGTGVAIAGAFALIRFRSVPGSSRDVVCVFFAMAVGVAAGAGLIYFAMTMTGVVCAVFVGIKFIPVERIGAKKVQLDRTLKITVPEDLDYPKELAPILAEFGSTAVETSIKTDKMGSLYVLTYRIRLKQAGTEKSLIDALRVKNGNLPIMCKTYTPEKADREL
jgi:hypothetical protein